MKNRLFIAMMFSMIVFLTGLWIITTGCESANRDEDVAASDEFGPGEHGPSIDDDSSDDDTSDDDTSDDDDDSALNNLAVVYGDSSLNSKLESFFTAYGFTADFVDESDTPTFDFSSYCAIMITETCNFYNTDEYMAIKNAQKKLFGMYQGGAILFGKLGLFASLGNATAYSLNQIVAENNYDHEIWNYPYKIDMTTQGLINFSTSDVYGLAHSTVPQPNGVYVFAKVFGTTGRGIITMEDGAYMFWGMELDTNYYLPNALMLMANAINYLCNS